MIVLTGKFIICSCLVVFLGIKLARYANKLCEKSHFSASIMGLFFVAIFTSFPEIFTSIGAVNIVFAPDMAVVDIIGSVIFNLTIIAIFAIYVKESFLLRASNLHITAALFTIVMLGTFICFLSLERFVGIHYSIFNVHISSFILAIMYFLGISLVYKKERLLLKERKRESSDVKNLWVKFGIIGVLLIVSSFWLAKTGKEIVDKAHLTEMFVGAIFLAITTSLPEIVVMKEALKAGAVNLAVGSILGSNLFNILVIPICDISLRKGALLSFVSSKQVVPAFVAIILTLIVMLRLKSKKKRRIFGMDWDIPAIVVVSLLWYAALFTNAF